MLSDVISTPGLGKTLSDMMIKSLLMDKNNRHDGGALGHAKKKISQRKDNENAQQLPCMPCLVVMAV